MHDLNVNRAQSTFKLFITHTAEIFSIRTKFIEYTQTALKVQGRWHKYQEVKKNRMKFLMFRFEYELENMIEH
jgi:hypothetical protein